MKFISLDGQNAYHKALGTIDSDKRVIVCGSVDVKESIEENLETALESSKEIIDASNKIDIKSWFAARKLEILQEIEELSDLEGDWPGEIENKQSFTLDRDLFKGTRLSEVLAMEVDVEENWHLPAYLKFGGWNDCPLTDVHCAVWRYWQEKYGAVIVGAAEDVIEAWVARPPKTKDEALTLAWEQYIYSYDIVEQGVETVAVLAALIMNGKKWYFWWD